MAKSIPIKGAKMSKENLDSTELLDIWCQQNRCYRFEGESGLDNLTKLVEVLGYKEHGFRHGSAIEVFLADNPGACDAIVEFITEWVDRAPEWRENLEYSICNVDEAEEG